MVSPEERHRVQGLVEQTARRLSATFDRVLAAGKITSKQVSPSACWNTIRPPCDSAICRATASPKPMPSGLLVAKGSNKRLMISRGGPGPLSSTRSTTFAIWRPLDRGDCTADFADGADVRSLSACGSTPLSHPRTSAKSAVALSVSTRTQPPGPAASAALRIRFMSSWRSWLRSAFNWSLQSGCSTTDKCTRRCRSDGSINSTTSPIISPNLDAHCNAKFTCGAARGGGQELFQIFFGQRQLAQGDIQAFPIHSALARCSCTAISARSRCFASDVPGRRQVGPTAAAVRCGGWLFPFRPIDRPGGSASAARSRISSSRSGSGIGA